MGYENRLFINNEWVKSKDGATFPLVNPTTDEVVTDVFEAGSADVDAAVEAAEKAFKKWKDMPVLARAPLFARLSQLIERDKEIFWELDRVSMGRTWSMAQMEVMAASGLFGLYATAGLYTQGQSSLNTPGMVNFTIKQPYGVVAAIIPWNVPMIMFAMKVGPALAAGNCIIVKPSEKAPLSSLHLAALIKEAGFPPGVLSVLPGNGPVTGSLLSQHMKIRKIAFTGSVGTGKKIMQMAAGSNLKPVTLELGGKSPAIVFEDADLDQAVRAIEFSIHHNSGQHCQANSRVFVHKSIRDKFVQNLKDLMESRKLGDPSDRETFQGPQVDKAQQERIATFLEAGAKDGKVVTGGKTVSINGKGCFVQPTIFSDLPLSSRVCQEEIFGPVLVVNTFETEDEVLAMANDSEYGLFGSLYTKNVDRALRFAKDMEAGAIGLNCSAPTQGLDMPVGGWKQSGIGREMFTYSMDNFLQLKAVYLKYADIPFGPAH
ncbi:hypothetical protein LTR67_003508 [Exophiala xenobiotica]